MEQLFQQLERFIATPTCIFEFKAIDYPTLLQQHLIGSYFELNQLLKNTPHSDIVRLLHSSSDRQSDVFLPGLLYSMFLDFSASQSLFETYMPILRSQSWLALDRLLQQVIRQAFSTIKRNHRKSLIPVLAKIHYYGQLSSDLMTLALKLIDCFDLSQHSLNFNNHFLEFVQCVLSQPSESNYLKELLADKFFYKLLRMLTLLNLLDEETMREYRQRCVAIAYRLFQLSKDRCLAMGWGAFGVIRELESDETLSRLVEECREELRRKPPITENAAIASARLSMVLPMRVESAVRFIIKEEISQLEVGVQMNWAFQKTEEHFEFLLIDILRYVLAQPQELPSKQGIFLFEWLFFRSCSNNVLFELWKSELFHPCFCQPCPYLAAPERALRFMAYLLQANFEFGETLLIYLLRQQAIPGNAKRLRQLLLEANSLNILDVQMLLNHSRLSPRAKAQLRAAIGDSSFQDVEKFKEEEAQPYYNPLEELQQRDSEMEIEFSPSQSSEHFDGYEEEIIQIQLEEPRGLKVRVEKMFAQDLGQSLTFLMREPNISLYKEFIRKLMEEIKTFKLNGETETIELFIVQAAKLTYLLFQNQFEIHNVYYPKDQNVIVHLLGIISNEWRTNSFLGQSCKKLIRKLVDMFPTAQAGVWRQFLLFFKRGVIAQVREMKEWLIPREKCDYVVALLRELGPISKDLVDNAEQLKLPLG